LLVAAAHRDALHGELLAENAVSGNLSCKSGQHTDQRDIAADARRALERWKFLHDLDSRYAAKGLGDWFDVHAARD